jgi:hypothetical protein
MARRRAGADRRLPGAVSSIAGPGVAAASAGGKGPVASSRRALGPGHPGRPAVSLRAGDVLTSLAQASRLHLKFQEIPMTSSHHNEQAGKPQTTASLLVSASPTPPIAGAPTTLRLMIHTHDGGMVREFDTVHEAEVHLIVVRDGLDEFAHLHPDVDDHGNLTVTHTFPAPGTYRLFVDYQPTGHGPAVAAGQVTVPGPARPIPPLAPDVPGRVTADGLSADVTVGTRDGGTDIRFALSADDRPVSDLRPYLGGLGHLILVQEGARHYVHVHPAGGDAAHGTLGFEAHVPEPGLFKGWLQVSRPDRLHTLPFVLGARPQGR